MAMPTRERLLDAALRSFATVGVEGTVITDLEEAAGLAPGSGGFYRYFRTKDEALDAVVRREILRVREQRVEPPPDSGVAHEIATDLAASLEMLSHLGPLIAILARERSRIPALAGEIAHELIDSGIASNHGLDSAALGAVVLSALVGYHLASDYFGTPPGGIGRDEFVETLAGLVARP